MCKDEKRYNVPVRLGKVMQNPPAKPVKRDMSPGTKIYLGGPQEAASEPLMEPPTPELRGKLYLSRGQDRMPAGLYLYTVGPTGEARWMRIAEPDSEDSLLERIKRNLEPFPNAPWKMDTERAAQAAWSVVYATARDLARKLEAEARELGEEIEKRQQEEPCGPPISLSLQDLAVRNLLSEKSCLETIAREVRERFEIEPVEHEA